MSKNGYDLYRCDACTHIFVSPVPSSEELDKLYSFESGYQEQESVRFAEKDDSEFPGKFQASVDQIRRHLTKGRILEVGSSIGVFLWLAGKAGFEAEGVELNPDTAAIARSNGLSVHVGRLEEAAFEPESFDAIHLGDLIEHVEDPRSLVTHLLSLLRPGGLLVVVTPNHDAFFPRATRFLHALGVPWSHPTPPFHLHQFSVQSLVSALADLGLETVEVDFEPCSLRYELGSTGVFGEAKSALRARAWSALPRHAARSALALVGYSICWGLDRAFFFKKHDFTMRLVARRSA